MTKRKRRAKRWYIPPSAIAYMQRKLACVEQRRSHAPTPADIERLLAAMQSVDEQTRARAVRQVCPCHIPWESFRQLRTAAKRLQHDSGALVRANARHVEEDAREIAAVEAMGERLAERGQRWKSAVAWPAKRGT